MQTWQIGMLVVAVVLFVLYLKRRSDRLNP